RKAIERRRILPATDELGVRLIRNVQNHRTAVDITDIGAIRPLRKNIGVVRAKASVELRIEPLRRRRAVAFARAWKPPAADLDGSRPIAHVDDPIELIVVRMPRLKVCGSAR